MIVFLKDEEEIKGFLEAGKKAGKILSTLLRNISAGITPLDIDELAREECKKEKVKPAFLGYQGFPAAVCVSVNENLVHGIPNKSSFKEGDVVSIDFGTDLDGFIGDTADTIVVGEFEEKQKIVNACRNALDRAIGVALSGNTLNDIGNEISKEKDFFIIKNYGGHGLDRYNLHADPFVPNFGNSNAYDVKLLPGMIIAIEPMMSTMYNNTNVKEGILPDNWTVFIKDEITTHSEHTVLITENNPIVLTAR